MSVKTENDDMSSWTPDEPYDRLPLLPPLHDVETRTVLKRIQNLVRAGLAQRQAASTHLKALVAVNVLEEVKLGREKIFLHPKLMNLLQHEANTVTAYEK